MTDLWRARTRRGVETIYKNSDSFVMIPPHVPLKLQSTHTDRWDRLPEVLEAYKGEKEVLSPFESGEFHPRIWRGNESPDPSEAGVWEAYVSAVRVSRMLFSRLRELFLFVEPNAVNDEVFGYAQRELIMLACTEVESAWKATLRANGASPIRGDDQWTTRDYVRLLAPMRLDEWTVSLSNHPSYAHLQPFQGWDPNKPSASLSWYDAYNKIKHDRETEIHLATLSNVINAMGAVYTMTIAQFGREHLEETHAFHPDEFQERQRPQWGLEELYIRPLKRRDNGDWLGFSTWIEKKLF